MAQTTDFESAYCAPFARAIEVVGKRWTGAILYALIAGRSRFNDLRRAVPGLSDRLLSERLKELEAEGLVVRRVEACTPVRIDYEVTEKGAGLLPAIRALEEWGAKWLRPDT
jgi:DNA-binding HxlR family transcriptional regulator